MQSRLDTQKDLVLNHLKNDNGITPLEALNLYGSFRLGAFRLAAIIFDLKKEGYDIQTNIIQNGGKRYANYKLRG